MTQDSSVAGLFTGLFDGITRLITGDTCTCGHYVQTSAGPCTNPTAGGSRGGGKTFGLGYCCPGCDDPPSLVWMPCQHRTHLIGSGCTARPRKHGGRITVVPSNVTCQNCRPLHHTPNPILLPAP